MSVEQSIIRRLQPQMATNRLAALVTNEIAKGCASEIHRQPCRLEPRYHPILQEPFDDSDGWAVFENPQPPDLLNRYRVWISPKQNCEWNRSELLLKQLSRLRHRAGFEICGNREAIRIGLLIHRDDEPVVLTSFRALFDESELSADPHSPMQTLVAWGGDSVGLRDYYPPAPYSHLLSSYEELKSTTFAGLIQALSQLQSKALGFYQCLFQPAAPVNNWHRNVEILLDLEFRSKLHRDFAANHPYAQQTPSGALNDMSREVNVKAHNDRPFFFTAVRVGIVGSCCSLDRDMDGLGSFMNLFQHGGRPLNYLTEDAYDRVIPRSALSRLIQRAITLRPGFLVNARELVGLAHVFVSKLVETRRVPLKLLETLPVRSPELAHGTFIGTCDFAGEQRPVCIPAHIRQKSTHIIASPGMGKSDLLINMFLQDIQSGKGAVFFDVHGDAIKKIRTLIPLRLYSRCVYFDPGDDKWIPIWNPLTLSSGGDLYRCADDIIGAFRRIFKDWGDRLEHVIRYAIIGGAYLPRTSMLDLYNLTRQKSPESEALRREIVKVAEDIPAKQFWKTDFLQDYRRNELQSPRHKLSQLVSAGNASLMLMQPDSRIELCRVMDEGQIMLIDLSGVGGEVAELLGEFILSLLFTAAMKRYRLQVHERKPFAIFLDEAHRFIASNAIEQVIDEARKFGVDLCLAHQRLSQFGTNKIDALSTTGCTILGRLDERDSTYFVKHFQDQVDPKDIMLLNDYEMIARIRNEVVRFRTHPAPEPPSDSDWRRMVEESRRKYCRPVEEVRAEIVRRSEVRNHAMAPLSGDVEEWPFTEKDLAYDEW